MVQNQLDLFSSSDSKNSKAMSVSDLNAKIKSQLETGFSNIWLKAEISNFKAHSSGHFYFSLKDERSQISAVMFKGQNARLRFRPKDGLEVLVKGRVTVYPPRGNYQILCESMETLGAGGLKEEFERLKNKLKTEGLFDPIYKKTIPYLPFKIALVTSPTGAAVRDMIQVLGRRHPSAEVIVVPTLTQGEKAAPAIIKALDQATKISGVEVVILSRGGGSLEDMWCFNDETLARKIHSIKTPIITGIGHEIDFTIADFVSDLRAPTPSAAAELVCKNVEEIRERTQQSEKRLQYKIHQVLKNLKLQVFYFEKRLIDPQKNLDEKRFRVDEVTMRMEQALRSKISNKKVALAHLVRQVLGFKNTFVHHFKDVEGLQARLLKSQEAIHFKNQSKLKMRLSQLKALSPLDVLERGYSIVKNSDTGKIIKNKNQIKPDQTLEVMVSKGKFKVKTLK